MNAARVLPNNWVKLTRPALVNHRRLFCTLSECWADIRRKACR